MGRKLFTGGSGLGRVTSSGSSSGVMERPWSFYFLALVIFLVKKLIKSSLLICVRIEGSTELWLFVNLAMVLKRIHTC